MSALLRYAPPLLLLISTALAVWGALGLIEYVYADAQFGLQNPRFPAGTQLLHFLALLATGLVFLVGYRTRWPYTPFATVTMYAVLATLCFVETVDFGAFGGGAARFIPMAVEYVVYVVLGSYLLNSPDMHRRFSGSRMTPGPSQKDPSGSTARRMR
jgi:hypothetical protein